MAEENIYIAGSGAIINYLTFSDNRFLRARCPKDTNILSRNGATKIFRTTNENQRGGSDNYSQGRSTGT